MVRSQPIELKLEQALRVCSYLFSLEMIAFDDDLKVVLGSRSWGGQMGPLVPYRGPKGPQIREATSKKKARCAIAGGKSLPPEGNASAG